MVNSIEDARRLAAWTKFPPLGERSWGPFRALSYTGLSMPDYLAKANGFSLTIAMVETREALNILDDILATPGIDGVFVGPSDLSIALTKGALIDQMHPEVDAALTLVATRARAHGKIASCFSPTAERAAELIRRGFHLSSIGTDVSIVKAAVKAELATARGLAKPATGQKGY
jgi:4-hydroxy-2-oxoheptanedioate aldolase